MYFSARSVLNLFFAREKAPVAPDGVDPRVRGNDGPSKGTPHPALRATLSPWERAETNIGRRRVGAENQERAEGQRRASPLPWGEGARRRRVGEGLFRLLEDGEVAWVPGLHNNIKLIADLA